LNIGSGGNVRDNFLNVDFYSFGVRVPWYPVDLRYPLPFRNESFEGAFSEHCVEHLSPPQAVALFRETLRTLKPGAFFRCAVPDLAKYVAFYRNEASDPKFSDFMNGCEAIWSLTQYWGHQSVWDAEMLKAMLKRAGFSRVDVCEFRQGSVPDLLIETEQRRWETLYVEAFKA
jgi:predicted SAM-dependent methyltransferase